MVIHVCDEAKNCEFSFSCYNCIFFIIFIIIIVYILNTINIFILNITYFLSVLVSINLLNIF